MKTFCVALAMTLGAAGCSSSNRAAQVHDTPPAAETHAVATTLASPATDRPEPASALPVYPGAVRLKAAGVPAAINVCGSTMRMVDYKVGDAGPSTIAQWYAARIPGGLRVIVPFDNGSSVSIYRPDGSAAATTVQIHVDPALARAIKSIGSDATTLGIVTFEPPLSPDVLQLLQRYANGDSSDKKASRAALKSKCPDLAR